MASCSRRTIKWCADNGGACVASFVFVFVFLLPAAAADAAGNGTMHAGEELLKYKALVRSYLARMNKPAVKSIKSADGDIIDCVLTHLQPAFDHPELLGQKPLEEPPEMPKGHAFSADDDARIAQAWSARIAQAWSSAGESCPDGTVPIRRTTEADILRASAVDRFAMKPSSAVRRDSTGDSHEHAVGFVAGGQYYGARASLNVWSPAVATPAEFSLSQVWLISGSFGNDLNTIEAGWQVSPELYGDSSPRFFTYWTTDAYQATGCYNLHCAGFVQTSSKIAIGAAISPTSLFNGPQFDITLLIWRDPRHGHWWLQLGAGTLVGYWPAFLFTHLGGHADMVQFGGEVVNTRPSGAHTATQMGSGRAAEEGPGRAAYFRGLETVDWDNSLVPAAGLRVLADHPACYDILQGYSRDWKIYFYYGGPGRSVRCP